MKKRRSIVVTLAIIVICVVASIYFINRYYLEDRYKEYLMDYTIEEGKVFVALNDDDSGIEGMVLAEENMNFKLYTNLITTEVAILEKATGKILYSNPQDREDDEIAIASNKSELNSTIVVRYYNSARIDGTVNNYDMSINNGQFTLEAIEDGIRYVYTLGKAEDKDILVPLIISEERMKTLIIDNLTAKEAREITGKYRLKNGVYNLTDRALNSGLSMSKLAKLFEQVGYTKEDYDFDMMEAEQSENIGFVIPLEYRLTEDGFQVSVPTNMIEEKGGASIYRLQILKFLGAEHTNEEGYIFVPNGSGSIINFKDRTNDMRSYGQIVYGADPVTQNYTIIENTQSVRMPVYGIKGKDTCYFARISNGEALAGIHADVAGKMNEYNYAYVSFSLREIEYLNMFGIDGVQADKPSLEKEFYDVNLSIDYTFLSGENADYNGMARSYREQLVKEGVLKLGNAGSRLPLYIDIVGGVERTEHLMGVPYRDVYSMTTFEQAQELAQIIKDNGVDNLRMNYVGWFNRGVYHDVPDKVKVIKELGKRNQLERLSESINKNGGQLYLDVGFNKVANTSKRYEMKIQSSKYHSGYVVGLGEINPSTLRQTSDLGWYSELRYSLLSPRFLPYYTEKFSDEISALQIDGIALRDLGSVLASDKKRSSVINRDMSQKIVVGSLDKLYQTEVNMLVKEGNAYVWAYADDLTDIPIGDSDFDIIDQEIPFYQMVIHGSISYGGVSLNLTGDYNRNDVLLKYIEYGMAPKFTLSYSDSTDIKYTSSASMYSVQYQIWVDEILSLYKECDKVLSKVNNETITNHTKYNNGLAKVTYGNGVKIYINHSLETIEMDGYHIDAKDYLVVGGVNQ